MSHISEGNSEEDSDDDEENVGLLLAPVAALGAPTPAMPRIQTSRKRIAPQTPTRPQGLPSRQNMSYLSPMPPDREGSSSLRPTQRPTNERAARGSILSWEQLATEASRSLGEDEFGRMLADIPAPFRSGAVSPSLSSQMDIPESPALSAIDSPGGFGSISQVLLPDVTPSPAVHHIQQARFSLSPEGPQVDSSLVTLLRLQLASVESTAKDRLFQIQAMEEEIHNLKQAHVHQLEESRNQSQYIESQQRRANDERAAYTASLEEQVRQANWAREQAVQDAQESIARMQESVNLSHTRVLEKERTRAAAASSASLASSKWGTVRSACEVELDLVRADRAMLTFLLTQVDQMTL